MIFSNDLHERMETYYQKLDTNANSNKAKLDKILNLLEPGGEILVDKRDTDELLHSLNDYFKKLQRDSLCEKNTELPEGTHRVIDLLERYIRDYKERTDEHDKRMIVKMIDKSL